MTFSFGNEFYILFCAPVQLRNPISFYLYFHTQGVNRTYRLWLSLCIVSSLLISFYGTQILLVDTRALTAGVLVALKESKLRFLRSCSSEMLLPPLCSYYIVFSNNLISTPISFKALSNCFFLSLNSEIMVFLSVFSLRKAFIASCSVSSFLLA